MLHLRPHHINCIFFYKGLGYNEEFSDKMNLIQKMLKEYPNTEIKLTKRCDELCKVCPNKKLEGSCKSEENILKLDNNTLSEYKLQEDKNYVFNELVNNIYMNFDEHKFYKICKECEWYKQGVCDKNNIEEHKNKWFGT